MMICNPYKVRRRFRAAEGAAPAQDPVQESPDPRREEQTLLELIGYFSQIQFRYDEYDRICRALYRSPGGPGTARLVWGIILSAFVLQIWFILMMAMSREGSLLYIRIVSLILSMLAAPGVVMIVTYAVKTRTHRRCDARFGELTRELERHYAAFGPCPVGFEYSNPAVLKTILEAVRCGRANTAGEAVRQLWGEACVRDPEALAVQNVLSARAAARGADAPAAFSAGAFTLR